MQAAVLVVRSAADVKVVKPFFYFLIIYFFKEQLHFCK